MSRQEGGQYILESKNCLCQKLTDTSLHGKVSTLCIKNIDRSSCIHTHRDLSQTKPRFKFSTDLGQSVILKTPVSSEHNAVLKVKSQNTCKVLGVVPSLCKCPAHTCCHHHCVCRPREKWEGNIHVGVILISEGRAEQLFIFCIFIPFCSFSLFFYNKQLLLL